MNTFIRLALALAYLFFASILGIPSAYLAINIIGASPADQMLELDVSQGGLLKVATTHADQFIADNNRLPTEAEFYKWVSSKKQEIPGLDGYGFHINTSKYPEDLTRNFGSPPVNGYVIRFWTGDVRASYISWGSRRNVTYVPDEQYFLFGSKLKSFALFIAISISLGASSIAVCISTFLHAKKPKFEMKP